VTKALTALLGVPGLVTVLLGKTVLAIVLILGGVAAAGASFLLAAAEHRAKSREERSREREHREERERAHADAERDWLRLLRTTSSRMGRVPRLGELSPHELGTDHEAVATAIEGATAQEANASPQYIERDRDVDLRRELEAAVSPDGPMMVILRGSSKAGKSRTLFEVAHSVMDLQQGWVLAPTDRKALARLLEPSSLPYVPPGLIVLWLDDLELFMTAGRRGMHPGALTELAGWGRPVVVVATAGGKGAEIARDKEDLHPIRELYNDPRVRVVRMS